MNTEPDDYAAASYDLQIKAIKIGPTSYYKSITTKSDVT